MAYTPNPTWVDGAGGGTLITAAALNRLELALQAAALVADNAAAGPYRPFTAASGVWQPPSNFTTAANSSFVVNALSAVPFDVGPASVAYSAIGLNVTTALAGGTTPSVRLGIYRDAGGGSPVGGTLLVDAGALTALTAVALVSLSITQTLTPGRYWLASCYSYAAAPTTALGVSCMSNAIAMPGSFFTNGYRGYTATATLASAAALPSTFPAANGGLSNVCVLGLKAT